MCAQSRVSRLLEVHPPGQGGGSNRSRAITSVSRRGRSPFSNTFFLRRLFLRNSSALRRRARSPRGEDIPHARASAESHTTSPCRACGTSTRVRLPLLGRCSPRCRTKTRESAQARPAPRSSGTRRASPAPPHRSSARRASEPAGAELSFCRRGSLRRGSRTIRIPADSLSLFSPRTSISSPRPTTLAPSRGG